jgi:hypothetical protein
MDLEGIRSCNAYHIGTAEEHIYANSLGGIAVASPSAGGWGEAGIMMIPETLCMACHETGTTRMVLTRVPFFRELIVSSFECDTCGWSNNEVGGSFILIPRPVVLKHKPSAWSDTSRSVPIRPSPKRMIRTTGVRGGCFVGSDILCQCRCSSGARSRRRGAATSSRSCTPATSTGGPHKRAPLEPVLTLHDHHHHHLSSSTSSSSSASSSRSCMPATSTGGPHDRTPPGGEGTYRLHMHCPYPPFAMIVQPDDLVRHTRLSAHLSASDSLRPILSVNPGSCPDVSRPRAVAPRVWQACDHHV